MLLYIMLGAIFSIARGYQSRMSMSRNLVRSLQMTDSASNGDFIRSDKPRSSRGPGRGLLQCKRDVGGDRENKIVSPDRRMSRPADAVVDDPQENNRSSANTDESPEEAAPSNPMMSLFKVGQPIKVEVLQFGPLGASVSVDDDVARGLILQREIAMFRDKRDGADVILGEILDAYVGKSCIQLDISLSCVDM
jgi:hypothetical protein